MPTPFPKKRFVMVMLVITVALLIWLIFGNHLIQAGTIPTPPPVTPPWPGSTPIPNDVIYGPSNQKPPDYLVTKPSFAGKVLHWTQTSYAYTTQSPDPANGRPVHVDIWMQIGDDGIPVIARTVSTFPDGTLHQANLYTSDTATLVVGPDYHAVSPTDLAECTINGTSYPVEIRRYLLSPFVDESLLSQFGFNRESTGSATQLPSTESLPETKPLEIYGRDTLITRWVARESLGESTNLKVLELGESGRVLFSQAQLTDVEGAIVNETWTAYGPLEIYDPVSVPTSAFGLNKQILESCNE